MYKLYFNILNILSILLISICICFCNEYEHPVCKLRCHVVLLFS
jgi:hypothetical protein